MPFFALYIFLMLLGFIMPNSKILSIIQLAFLWFIFWHLDYPSDLDNYKFVYTLIAEGNNEYLLSYEPLFTMLMKACSSVGMDFVLFRLAVGTISYLLLYTAISFFTKNTAFVLSMCFIFPCLPFGWIIRAFLSSTIVIFAVRFLLSKRIKWFVIFVVIASFIHYSAIFYFVFLLVDKKLEAGKVIILIFFEVLLLVVYSQNWLVPVASLISDNPKFLSWFRPGELSHVSIIGFLFVASVYVFLLLLVKYACKNTTGESSNSKDIIFASLAERISIMLMLTLPFTIASEQFIRILYGILPLMYCSCANMDCYKIAKKISLRRGVIYLSQQSLIPILFAIWTCLYFNIIYSPTGYTTFSAFFS